MSARRDRIRARKSAQSEPGEGSEPQRSPPMRFGEGAATLAPPESCRAIRGRPDGRRGARGLLEFLRCRSKPLSELVHAALLFSFEFFQPSGVAVAFSYPHIAMTSP